MNSLARIEPDAPAGRALVALETSSTAAASQAKAMVEARYLMALQRPRNLDQVRQNLIRECKRPMFARNKSAYYVKPIGDGVEGLGIRFVEVALRCMTNVLIETSMIFEDADKEIHRVSVTDLESNVTYPLDVKVTKSVERSKKASDGSYISVRKNSYGKDVYTVVATDEDLLNKRGALISKAIRTLGLRIIPGDMQDEAEEIIKAVRLDDAARDPSAERKKIADAFGELNVNVTDLNYFLGHPLDQCSPAELVKLRGIYGAIKEGEATWAQVIDNKAANGDSGSGAGELKWSVDDFDAGLKKWTALIVNGKKTPEEIITIATTKAPLSDAQREVIRGLNSAASIQQLDSINAAANDAAISWADIRKKFGLAEGETIPVRLVPEILAFIANPVPA